jgi:hypothetical protein
MSVFDMLADRVLPDRGVLAYHDDPAGFVTDCIHWPPGQGPASYQLQIMRALVDHGRVAVRAPHGVGKTTTLALLTLWFATTRNAAGTPWKVVLTAGGWRQLERYLWPEIHHWARRLDWERIGRAPFAPATELMRLGLRLSHGEAFAVAAEDPQKIEGAHADALFYIFDESKAIAPATFDAAEGAFAGAGEQTGREALAIASSTPGAASGRFYDFFRRAPGLEDWYPMHVTLAEAIAAGRLDGGWAAQRKAQFGAGSAAYANRVLGDFASGDEDGVIPLSWIEAANDRWLALDRSKFGPLTSLGVDVARSERGDRTVLALRYGDAIGELRRYSTADTMEVVGYALAALSGCVGTPPCVVDVIGVGGGVVDRLREQYSNVIAHNGSASSDMRDRSGELQMANTRSATIWGLREGLDPAGDSKIALPPDDLLTGDLTAPRWRVNSSGKIQVELKEEIKKHLGRSPDDGDAVSMAFFLKVFPTVQAPRVIKKVNRYAPLRPRFGGQF